LEHSIPGNGINSNLFDDRIGLTSAIFRFDIGRFCERTCNKWYNYKNAIFR